MPVSRLVVPGEPTTKDRPRVERGRARNTEKTSAAENEIHLLWKERRRPRVPDGEMFALRITARFAHKKSHRNAKGEVRDKYRVAVPGGAKDWDNIGKLVSDALNGVAWSDDRYCTAGLVIKEWAPDHMLEGELDIEVVWSDRE